MSDAAKKLEDMIPDMIAYGTAVAAMYRGMIDGGVDHEVALELTKHYMKPSGVTEDQSTLLSLFKAPEPT